jgi:hypothetical protein
MSDSKLTHSVSDFFYYYILHHYQCEEFWYACCTYWKWVVLSSLESLLHHSFIWKISLILLWLHHQWVLLGTLHLNNPVDNDSYKFKYIHSNDFTTQYITILKISFLCTFSLMHISQVDSCLLVKLTILVDKLYHYWNLLCSACSK